MVGHFQHYALGRSVCSLRNKSKSGIVRGPSFGLYAKFSEKLTFLTRTCACQGLRNVSFSENFVCVLNERSLTNTSVQQLKIKVFQPLMKS